MHNSCDQARWIWIRIGYSKGISTRNRWTTVMKVSTVASPIRLAMMISSSRSRMRKNINVPGDNRAALSNRPTMHALPRRLHVGDGSVHRAAAGLFQEFVDQGLTDARRHVLVDRQHRLAHRLVLLLRQRDDLGLAGL